MMDLAEPRITQGTLRAPDGSALPLEHTDVQATVSGPFADVVVRQRFRNGGTVPIEAVYLFPLPHEASVHRMEFRVADRVVRAVLREKAEARRVYQQALSEGRAATLLEEDRPALFTLSVANVAPGAVIDVEFAYQELLAYDDGRWGLVFPMVAPETYQSGPAPRPGDVLPPPPRMPTGARGPDVSVTVNLTGPVEDLRSPSHAIEKTAGGGGTTVTLARTGAVANRDFALSWQAAAQGVRPVVCFERAAGEAGTFLLVVTPSAQRPSTDRPGGGGEAKAVRCGNCGGVVKDFGAIKDIPGLGPVFPCGYCGAMLAPGTETVTRATKPRDVFILVDRSASMRGASGQLRAAVDALLGSLDPADAVEVVAFDHDRTSPNGAVRLRPLSPEVIALAGSFVDNAPPRGGTDLEEALADVSAVPARDGRTRVVVLLTDAAVGNEGRLLRRVPELLGEGGRLFVLGVGPAVDRRLVSRLAEIGRGACDVLSPGEEPSVTLARFARRVREAGPVLRDLTLWWEGAGLADVTPATLPDLYDGQPVRVLGRFTGVGPTRLVLTGTSASGKAFRQELPVDLPAASNEVPGLARLWARRRVEALSEEAARDPSHAPGCAAEALSLSLRYTILGPYTSFVAEDLQRAVAAVRTRKGRLVMEQGPEPGRVFTLDRARTVVGRAPNSDISVLDRRMSRAHCEVRVSAAGFIARDLATTNGTRADGRDVREVTLRPGMKLTLGATVLRFEEVGGEGAESFFALLPTERVDVPMAAPERATAAEGIAPRGLPMTPGAPKGAAAPLAYGAPEVVAASRSRAGFSPAPAMAFGGAPPPFDAAPTGMPAPAPPPAPARPAAPMALPGARPPMGAPMPMAPPMIAPMPMAPPMIAPVAPPVPSVGARAGGYAGPPSHGVSQQARAQIPQSPIEVPGSEPYPENELLWLKDRLRGELDLVFLVDETGSMGPYIEEVQRQLLGLVDALRVSPLCKSLRLGIVAYRDHPPQDPSYASRVVPLTADVQVIRGEVARLFASGGGDGPESVTDGLFDLVRLDWRPGAVKAVVWFGDAPPHGVEPTGDAFPGGCPCGHQWYAQAESCREMGITVYAIGCLPGLRSFVGAEGVFRTVARATRGMFLPLREAGLLVPMIAGAAVSELDRARVDLHVEELVRACGAPLTQTDEAERVRWVTEALRRQGVRPRAMAFDPDAGAPGPARFRDVQPEDVSGSFARLRMAGRMAC